jgi:transcriptional regulator with XRE-family HTH domain
MTNRLKYDEKVALTITSLRKLKGIKQLSLANALCIDQSVYSRMESGTISITLGQLKIISEILDTSTFQIIAIVEHEFETKTPCKNISLPSLIANYILSSHSHATIDEYGIAEYEKVVEIILEKINQLKS